jgi:hypothetical protein
MTLRLRHQAIVVVAADTDERRINFRRTEEVTTTVIRNDLVKDDCKVINVPVATPGVFPLPPTPTEVTIPFTLLGTAHFLYVETDAEIYLKINGAAAGLKVTPATGQLAKVLWDGEFTALVIGNSSLTTAANVTYALLS